MFDFLLDYGSVGAALLVGIGAAALLFERLSLIGGMVRLASALRLPTRVTGLGLLPFCTCAPYWVVAVAAAWNTHPDIAVGTVIGCSLINLCLILGFTTFLGSFRVPRLLLYREFPLLAFLPGVILVLAYLGSSGSMSDIVAGRTSGRLYPFVGAAFLLGLAVYLFRAVTAALRGHSDAAFLAQIDASVRNEEKGNRFESPAARAVATGCELIIGLGLLLVGGDALIKGGSFAAKGFGVNELQISLGLLSAGLSLPLFVAVVSAVLRRDAERALDMIVVANIFNLLGVLGLTVLLADGALHISSQAMQYDLPMLLIASVVMAVFGFTDQKYSRGEGLFLLAFYGFYVLLLVMTVVSDA